MKVDVYRKVESGRSITGEFWVDGAFECYYLEPARLTPYYPGHPCIQAGTYRVVLTMSPHLGYICPEFLMCQVGPRSDGMSEIFPRTYSDVA